MSIGHIHIRLYAQAGIGDDVLHVREFDNRDSDTTEIHCITEFEEQVTVTVDREFALRLMRSFTENENA